MLGSVMQGTKGRLRADIESVQHTLTQLKEHFTGSSERIAEGQTHRDVIADEIPVALLSVELHREAAHIPQRLGRPAQLCTLRLAALPD